MEPQVKAFFDEATFTVSYVVSEPEGRHCAIIDPVLDFDAKSGRTGSAGADAMIAYVRDRGLTVDWILETHVHADHLTAAPYLKSELGGRTAIGDRIPEVQMAFRSVFNPEPDFAVDGSQFDHLFADGERFAIGAMAARVLATPGHTPACITYVIGKSAFVGDTIFMPDYGSARTDFPGGDARILYHSVQKLFALPEDSRLYLCHDYKAPGRDHYAWETTVAEQLDRNLHLHRGVGEAEFVEMREARDSTLSLPALILPAVQVNMRGGRLPPPENNGISYLKIPVNAV